jgi:predicted small lipoprotein YifL
MWLNFHLKNNVLKKAVLLQILATQHCGIKGPLNNDGFP